MAALFIIWIVVKTEDVTAKLPAPRITNVTYRLRNDPITDAL